MTAAAGAMALLCAATGCRSTTSGNAAPTSSAAASRQTSETSAQTLLRTTLETAGQQVIDALRAEKISIYRYVQAGGKGSAITLDAGPECHGRVSAFIDDVIFRTTATSANERPAAIVANLKASDAIDVKASKFPAANTTGRPADFIEVSAPEDPYTGFPVTNRYTGYVYGNNGVVVINTSVDEGDPSAQAHAVVYGGNARDSYSGEGISVTGLLAYLQFTQNASACHSAAAQHAGQ